MCKEEHNVLKFRNVGSRNTGKGDAEAHILNMLYKKLTKIQWCDSVINEEVLVSEGEGKHLWENIVKASLFAIGHLYDMREIIIIEGKQHIGSSVYKESNKFLTLPIYSSGDND